MDYEKMVEKVKAFLGEKTEGMISTRTSVEVQDNGDIHFRRVGTFEGTLYLSKTSQCMVADISKPLAHLKTLADVRAFFGMKKLFDLVEDEENAVVCTQCEVLKAEVEDLNNTIRNQELYLKKVDIAEAKIAVYEEVFNGRSNIHIER